MMKGHGVLSARRPRVAQMQVLRLFIDLKKNKYVLRTYSAAFEMERLLKWRFMWFITGEQPSGNEGQNPKEIWKSSSSGPPSGKKKKRSSLRLLSISIPSRKGSNDKKTDSFKAKVGRV